MKSFNQLVSVRVTVFGMLSISLIGWLLGGTQSPIGAQVTDPVPDQTLTATPGASSTLDATISQRLTVTATPTTTAEPGSRLNPLLNPCTNQPFDTAMDGTGIKDAEAGVGGAANNQWVVNFTLANNTEGQKFGPFTASHIAQPLAIVLDGLVLSVPTIQAALPIGGQITGNFSQAEATALAVQINSGFLGLPMSITSFSSDQSGADITLTVTNLPFDLAQLTKTSQIIEARLKALRFAGVTVQIMDNTLHVHADGIRDVHFSLLLHPITGDDLETFSSAVGQTGLLEFVDFSRPENCQVGSFPVAGQYILTKEDVALTATSSGN